MRGARRHGGVQTGPDVVGRARWTYSGSTSVAQGSRPHRWMSPPARSPRSGSRCPPLGQRCPIRSRRPSRTWSADFGWSGPIGITFPGVVIGGITCTAANLDPAWIGLDARALFGKATGMAGQPAQRRRRGRGRRDDVRGRRRRARDGAPADLRHRDRQRAVHRRPAGAQHRVRPHRDPRQGRRGACLGTRAGAARPELGQMGGPRRRVPRRTWRPCSGPACSSSAAASAGRRTSSSRC